MPSEPDPEDTFKVMVATDIHLGVHEKDGLRGDDSFNTFEEILELSHEHDVDFVLLAGDMFHDNKPSGNCIKKTLELLRKYCMGDKPITVEFLSDESEIFKNCAIPRVNYQDPNMNVSIPVYSIHGNHDDPCGFGRTSAMDILSVSGYVNYFGKMTDLTKVTLKPILLKKGRSKLALYGLSHIKDERLNRLFKMNLVEFERPPSPDSWFNILLLHQNRVERSTSTNHIQEVALPDFMDLVIWGHEHECRIVPEYNETQQFYVTQPGSPVATSLCEGEAIEKKVGILKISLKEFKLEPIKLRTVRPFVFERAKISDWSTDFESWSDKEVQAYASRYIKSRLLSTAKEQLTGHPRQPTLPLIRLRLDYSEERHCFNSIRFGQSFTGVVANEDLISMKKVPNPTRASRKDNKAPSFDPDDLASQNEDIKVDTLVELFFSENKKQKQLEILSLAGMSEGVARFIDKDDKDSIGDLVRHQMNRTVKYLTEKNVEPEKDKLEESIKEFKLLRVSKRDEEIEEVRKMLEGSNRGLVKNINGKDSFKGSSMDLDDDEDDFGPMVSEPLKPPTGRGSRGGRGSRAKGTTSTRARGGRGRGAKANSTASNSSNNSILNYTSVSTTRSRVSSDSDEDIQNAFNYPTPKKKQRTLKYGDDD